MSVLTLFQCCPPLLQMGELFLDPREESVKTMFSTSSVDAAAKKCGCKVCSALWQLPNLLININIKGHCQAKEGALWSFVASWNHP